MLLSFYLAIAGACLVHAAPVPAGPFNEPVFEIIATNAPATLHIGDARITNAPALVGFVSANAPATAPIGRYLFNGTPSGTAIIVDPSVPTAAAVAAGVVKGLPSRVGVVAATLPATLPVGNAHAVTIAVTKPAGV